MQETTEQWKDIPDCDGKYAVSNLGNVRGARGGILRPASVRGYDRVCLRTKSGQKNVYVHCLVAEAFLEKREGQEVNHKHGIKTANSALDLEYMTHPENQRHAVEHGLYRRGEEHQNAKLTNDQVKGLFQVRKSGGSVMEYARLLGVHYSGLYKILKGRSWSHITE